MDALKPMLNGVSILGLLFTLIVMFALKGDLILQRPAIVLEMAIPMTLFFITMFFVVLLVGWRLRFSYRDAVAVAFNATGRDFEIAIASRSPRSRRPSPSQPWSGRSSRSR